jgi:hypothetical protein
MKNTESLVNSVEITQEQTDIRPYTGLLTFDTPYIPFGSDNLFPNAIALFGRLSANHKGVINSKVRYTIGSEIISEDQKFKGLIESANLEKMEFQEIIKRQEKDWNTTGNKYMELITDGSTFLFLNHIDSTKVRKTKDNQRVIIHPDWNLYTGKSDKNAMELPLFPKFDRGSNYEPYRSVVHYFDYEPEFSYYGLPSWIAGKDNVQIDYRSNRWNLATLINTAKLSGMLIVPVSDKTESELVLKKIKEHHQGDMNQNKLLVLTKGRATENQRAEQTQYISDQQSTKTNNNGDWLQLHKMNTSDLIVAHSWYRALTSLDDNTGFETEKILNEYNIALNSYIKPRQKTIKKQIQKLYKQILNWDIDFSFINESPVSTDDAMYIWELRRQKGLDYDENDPNQQKMIYNGSIIN